VNILAIDTEATTHNKGNPYDSRNRMVCYSIATSDDCSAIRWDEQAGKNLQLLCNGADLLVGFNFKYDLHWLIKYGIKIDTPVWDVQLAEFILSHQTIKFPSLNDTCLRYGIPTKKDVVKEEYWEKGIQTDEIPWPILEEYAAHDAKITLEWPPLRRRFV
jgi:DNA polymerase I-like protein with 3'-5' exonuclease and polymerase domains